MNGTLEHCFAPDLAAAAGHFPDNPIIPGAVLLSETLKAIERHSGLVFSPCRINAAKFFYPARPGDRLRIEYSQAPPHALRFSGAVGDKTVVTGIVTCPAIDPRA